MNFLITFLMALAAELAKRLAEYLFKGSNMAKALSEKAHKEKEKRKKR